uniref:Uncharacterized protein n=1 Tax=Pyrodinium bahamense TaxID=73915 RepID=A0A7R9ZZX1_9DINO
MAALAVQQAPEPAPQAEEGAAAASQALPGEQPPCCTICDDSGHQRCGAEWWALQRAQWLGRPLDQVGKRAPRDAQEVREAEGDGPIDAKASGSDNSWTFSEAERLSLRGCLAAVEAPYPPLRRPVPLSVAVHCAVELWGDDGALADAVSPYARIAEAARAGSQELLEKTAALGSSIAKWGHGLFGSGVTTQVFGDGAPQAGSDVKGNSRLRSCDLGIWDGEDSIPYPTPRVAADRGNALCASLRSRGGVSAPTLAATAGPTAGNGSKASEGAAAAAATATCCLAPLQPAGAACPEPSAALYEEDCHMEVAAASPARDAS